MEQYPLVVGIASDSAQVARVLREGADVLDLGRASGMVVHEVRHTHPEVPLAIDVACGAGSAGDADLVYASDGVTGRELAAIAAAAGAAVVCLPEEVERVLAEGVTQVVVTSAWRHGRQDTATLRRARELAAGEWPVLVTVASGDSSSTAPDSIAAAALAAMAGVRFVRTDRVTETRRTVDMIASIAGTRQPARVRRALA